VKLVSALGQLLPLRLRLGFAACQLCCYHSIDTSALEFFDQPVQLRQFTAHRKQLFA
jgi:hypothetical protein